MNAPTGGGGGYAGDIVLGELLLQAIWDSFHKACQLLTPITIRLSIFLTLARACDKRFSADHDTGCVIIIEAFQHNGNLQQFCPRLSIIHSINDREHY